MRALYVALIGLLTLTGCQVVVETQNRYPGRPLPEQVRPPETLIVPLLSIYGGGPRSRPVDWQVFRVYDRRVYSRPFDVTVVNLSQRHWRQLRTRLLIPADAHAACTLEVWRPVPYYHCRVPRVYLPYGRR